MRFRRRGIMLTHVMAVLPLIAVITTVSYGVTQRVIRYQGALKRHIMSEARMEGIVRQLRHDAARAQGARLGSPGGEELVLTGCTGRTGAGTERPGSCTVTYRFSESQMTRTETAAGAAPVTTSWQELPGGVRLQLEGIGGNPRVVWATWNSAAPTDMGPGHQRTVSVAAVIGGGA